jgi:hypothetical protein
MASFLRHAAVKPNISHITGGFTMPEFFVAIDHLTSYAVQAEDEVSAIDLALEGQGIKMDSETRDSYISDYQKLELRREV